MKNTCFTKTLLNRMEPFEHKKMLKVGNKHMTLICDICSKLSIGTQKQCHIFSLWTAFNNPVASLLLTFNKYIASGFLSFSMHLCFNILSVGVNTSAHQNIWEGTSKKWALERKP